MTPPTDSHQDAALTSRGFYLALAPTQWAVFRTFALDKELCLCVGQYDTENAFTICKHSISPHPLQQRRVLQ